MNYLKKLGISFIYIISLFFILSFIVTLFNFIGFLNGGIFKILVPIISLFVGGFVLGRDSKSKGWLEGLKLGLIFLLILILVNFLALQNSFHFKNILFYVILCVSCMFGSMIGISFKGDKKN